MAAISLLNPKADVARAANALAINITAAKALELLMSTNLGPKGTTKMLVSPAGDIKITKSGNVLLSEMNIKHPTAAMIARTCLAQHDSTGDGTTSTVLLIGELLKQAELIMSAAEVHPRFLTKGILQAREKALEILDSVKMPIDMDKSTLLQIARTSLGTKLGCQLADLLSEICVNAVLAVRRVDDQFFDLNMIEIMEMQQHCSMHTQLIEGLVLDHGGRHVKMPQQLQNAFLLTCNVNLELFKTTTDSVFCYNTSEALAACVLAEHDFIDARVKRIIELKRRVCQPGNGKSFVVINQKGIDPLSLEALAAEGILALRRAKPRNMERLMRACGGEAVNCLEQLKPEQLGFAGLVYEQQLGETKYTFVLQCRQPASVTILIKAQHRYELATIKDAVRYALHALNNAMQDKCVVAGAGAYELRAYQELLQFKQTLIGKPQLGVQLFAHALLVIPRSLARNSGFDVQDSMLQLLQAASDSKQLLGLNLNSGQPVEAARLGILDNYCVKKQMISSSAIIASNLLLTDEIIRAGITLTRS